MLAKFQEGGLFNQGGGQSEFFYNLNAKRQQELLGAERERRRKREEEVERQAVLEEQQKQAILENERKLAMQAMLEEQELQRQQAQQQNLAQVAQDLYGKYETYQTFSNMFGGQGGFGGGMSSPSSGGAMGAWAGPVSGALMGFQQGMINAQNDPNMSNKKQGFGTKYPDVRAQVGGAVLGGVLGYFGGPIGASFAEPAVALAHPIMEPTTRALINFGDSWGGAGGALMMDPIGTLSSGKYSVGQLAKGFFLGPFSKLIK